MGAAIGRGTEPAGMPTPVAHPPISERRDRRADRTDPTRQFHSYRTNGLVSDGNSPIRSDRAADPQVLRGGPGSDQ